MLYDDVRLLLFDDFSESGERAEIEATALRNDYNFQARLPRGGDEFSRRLTAVAIAFERDDARDDLRKVGRLFVEFTRRAMKLQDVFRDRVDRCRFDDGKNFDRH